jgi:hypothetical protein
LAIVEELKELINPNENIKDTLKHFNELRERWKTRVLYPKTNTIMWKLHVEKFYLHLDREARDLDFKQPRLKAKNYLSR